MSPLTKLLLESGGVQLRWNVVGVDDSGNIDLDKFAVHFFSVDYGTGRGGFDAPLTPQQVAELHAFLEPFATSLGVQPTGASLKVVNPITSVLTVLELLPMLDDAAISKVLKAIGSQEKLEWLANNLDGLQRAELEASLRHARRQDALEHLRLLIDEDSRPEGGDIVALCRSERQLSAYLAGKPETVFQRWFESNTWVFGREYHRRHPLRVIGLDSEADLVLETTDGYLDLVELKRPAANVLAYKRGSSPERGFYYPHSDLSIAYGQCVRYLADLERFRYQLQETYDARIVAPRILLVVGRSNRMDEAEKDALRRTESTFHQIHVLTYDQVLLQGQQLLSDPVGWP